ncbi:MAG: hypothetical protein MK171_04495 [Pirellulales bacterium]|nr:hypothetical protein [Pirellulales bacterium]
MANATMALFRAKHEVGVDLVGILLPVPIVAVIETATWVALALAALLAVLLMHGFGRLRGTTLAAPCLWTVTAVAGLAGLAAAGGSAGEADGIYLSAARFASAAMTLCPMMAVLGAKRPQDRGWQWVVLTLWIVLVWPAAQAVLMLQGPRVELYVAWKIFVAALVGVGLLSYLPTRNGAAAVLVAVGQLLLLDEFLEFLSGLATVSRPWTLPVGLGCFASAALLVRFQPERSPAKSGIPSTPSVALLSAQWQHFRDAYGAFWALRVLGRINQNAEIRQWPVRLGWSGFESLPGDQSPPPAELRLAELEQSTASLLRRFVRRDSA